MSEPTTVQVLGCLLAIASVAMVLWARSASIYKGLLAETCSVLEDVKRERDSYKAELEAASARATEWSQQNLRLEHDLASRREGSELLEAQLREANSAAAELRTKLLEHSDALATVRADLEESERQKQVADNALARLREIAKEVRQQIEDAEPAARARQQALEDSLDLRRQQAALLGDAQEVLLGYSRKSRGYATAQVLARRIADLLGPEAAPAEEAAEG